MSSKPTPGSANSSSWNDSAFAFAPNTNTMDPESMPSDQAQVARDKANEVMAAVRAGDMQRANALMGKDETPGRFLPGMSWLKKKRNNAKPAGKVNGAEVVVSGEDGGDGGDVDDDKKVAK